MKVFLPLVAWMVRGGVLVLVLAACGGGGDAPAGGPPAPQPKPAPAPAPAPVVLSCVFRPPDPDGVFGAVISPTNETMVMITHNLDIYGEDSGPIVFVGNETGSAFVPISAARVGPTCQTGNQPPRNTYLFGEDALLTAAIDPATPSMTGEIRTSAATRTFAGGRIGGSSYDFNQPATASTAVGTLVSMNGGPSFSILADGSVTGSGNCRASGRVTPRADGKNLLSIEVTLDPATCKVAWSRHEGVVLAYERAEGGRRLFARLFATDGWDWEEYFLTGSEP